MTIEESSKNALIRYRLRRADDTFSEALSLTDLGSLHGAVNRLYYSCFYAVSALLLSRNLSSAKHSGIRALFNKHVVVSGIIQRNDAKIYNELFEYRQEGDYEDFVEFNIEEIKGWIQRVRVFITQIKEAIKDEFAGQDDRE